MTPFTVGQAVTFPHSQHTTGGIVRRVWVRPEDGAEMCSVEMANGHIAAYESAGLYAKEPQRKSMADAAVKQQQAKRDAAAYRYRDPREVWAELQGAAVDTAVDTPADASPADPPEQTP
jgi:hypothetical protein